MSAQLAIAEPRRIKASHRRRRKVTAGHFVQRYYDPQIGRFLSVDPVPTNPNNGGNFNRYWYANNNPYRFTDPDGRAACPGQKKSECMEANTRIPAMKTSVDTSAQVNQGIVATAPAVGDTKTGPEKGIFVASDGKGGTVGIQPASATTATQSGKSIGNFTPPPGVKPLALNHGHINEGVNKSQGLASAGDGRAAVDAGYPIGVVSGGNVAVVTAPEGRLRIQILEGEIVRGSMPAVQRLLDQQQRAMVEEGK